MQASLIAFKKPNKTHQKVGFFVFYGVRFLIASPARMSFQ